MSEDGSIQSAEQIKEILSRVSAEAFTEIENAGDLKKLDEVRVQYLGRKADFTLVLRSFHLLSQDERKVYGRSANELRAKLQTAFDKKKQILEKTQGDASLDWTLPAGRPRRGAEHPISKITREIVDVFKSLNFDWVEGREIETEFYNFTALNIPEDHPSREGFDTFFTTGGHLLRSQTSTVQIRVMENRKPPLRIIAPGRVYRPDTVDASHSFMFHQIEGLMIDSQIRFSDLKGILHLFLRTLFGKDVKLRFRPSFFPFTEPSAEIDMLWGKDRWLEVMGAGSVDPRVFQAVGYDPNEVQGFAFGLGVERLAMLLYGIDDIRLFYENDERFLKQFQYSK